MENGQKNGKPTDNSSEQKQPPTGRAATDRESEPKNEAEPKDEGKHCKAKGKQAGAKSKRKGKRSSPLKEQQTTPDPAIIEQELRQKIETLKSRSISHPPLDFTEQKNWLQIILTNYEELLQVLQPPCFIATQPKPDALQQEPNGSSSSTQDLADDPFKKTRKTLSEIERMQQRIQMLTNSELQLRQELEDLSKTYRDEIKKICKNMQKLLKFAHDDIERYINTYNAAYKEMQSSLHAGEQCDSSTSSSKNSCDNLEEELEAQQKFHQQITTVESTYETLLEKRKEEIQKLSNRLKIFCPALSNETIDKFPLSKQIPKIIEKGNELLNTSLETVNAAIDSIESTEHTKQKSFIKYFSCQFALLKAYMHTVPKYYESMPELIQQFCWAMREADMTSDSAPRANAEVLTLRQYPTPDNLRNLILFINFLSQKPHSLDECINELSTLLQYVGKVGALLQLQRPQKNQSNQSDQVTESEEDYSSVSEALKMLMIKAGVIYETSQHMADNNNDHCSKDEAKDKAKENLRKLQNPNFYAGLKLDLCLQSYMLYARTQEFTAKCEAGIKSWAIGVCAILSLTDFNNFFPPPHAILATELSDALKPPSPPIGEIHAVSWNGLMRAQITQPQQPSSTPLTSGENSNGNSMHSGNA